MNTEELVKEINRLKEEKNALILGHNYQIPEIQEVSDILGDSLKLSREAAETDKDLIVFCGVEFMAESAKILSPDKKVLLPNKNAGCPMADMMTAEGLIELKKEYPGVPVVTYVNSTAEVKAETDICCTSSNSINVVKSLESDKVIFGPDRNLGSYIQKFVDKEIILWDGYCPTHERLVKEDIINMRMKHPDAEVLVHPEARPEAVEIADFVGSTSQIIERAKTSSSKKFLIGTEIGILNIMRKNNLDKEFIILTPQLICPNMKKTELKHLYEALKYEQYEIEVDEEVAKKARKALDRMVEIS